MICEASPKLYASLSCLPLQLTSPISLPPCFSSQPLRSLVDGLLTTNPVFRLGCGKAGALEIKSHPWFEGLNWEAFAAKKLPAPYLPQASSVNSMNPSTSGTFGTSRVQTATTSVCSWSHHVPYLHRRGPSTAAMRSTSRALPARSPLPSSASHRQGLSGRGGTASLTSDRDGGICCNANAGAHWERRH